MRRRRAFAGAAALGAALFAAACGAPLMKLPTGPGTPVADGAFLLGQATASATEELVDALRHSNLHLPCPAPIAGGKVACDEV